MFILLGENICQKKNIKLKQMEMEIKEEISGVLSRWVVIIDSLKVLWNVWARLEMNLILKRNIDLNGKNKDKKKK